MLPLSLIKESSSLMEELKGELAEPLFISSLAFVLEGSVDLLNICML